MRRVPVVVLGCLLLAGCAGTSPVGGTSTAAPRSPTASLPAMGSPGGQRPDHVVVVVMENHAYGDVAGNPAAPWVNGLPAAVFTNWFGVTHPSQPNYLALFSGSTHGVTDDGCPLGFDAPNLASQLDLAGLTFTGYAEGLPRPGDAVCQAGDYARKHAPWTDFTGLPASVGQPLSAFPADHTRLPTVAFVIPDLCHDTHDCPVAVGDHWLSAQLGDYATWAQTHNSLLVLTYDEDDSGAGNHILTVVTGAGVAPGRYGVRGDHYTLLRTLEALYGLPPLGAATGRSSVQPVWSRRS
jgi:acid phosphatase